MRDDDVNEFIALTKSTRQTARHFLANNNGELSYALNNFYDTYENGFIEDIRPVSQQLVELFEKYCDEKSDAEITTDGLVRFVGDLGFELEDLATLCLAHDLNCKGLQDPITRDQFVGGWHSIFCDTFEDIRTTLIEQSGRLQRNPEYLETIYKYTYGLVLEPNQKALQLESAQEYWNLFFGRSTDAKLAVQPSNTLLELWQGFLSSRGHIKISRDVWQMFFKFIQKYSTVEALKSEYNELDAWPLLIDEFYEHLEDQGTL
ncbi:LAFA_0E04368g1_1 [Lachancea sp. 'fantastica']|nr:LAFA_0E04368g1_1 [Lachancea sp. 'fantastica']